MIIKSIGHTGYRCKDMEKSLHFYCDVLGLKKVFDIKNSAGEPWIEYLKVCDGQFIELFYTKEDMLPFALEKLSYAHICLEVFDIHEAVEAIRKTGYPIDIEPKKGADNNWQAWVVDPDGNRVELMQIDPESPHAKC